MIFLAMLLWLHMTLLRRQLQRSQEFPWILPCPLPQCRLDWQMVLGELAWPQRLLVVRLMSPCRLVVKFNHFHTVNDIRNFVNLYLPLVEVLCTF